MKSLPSVPDVDGAGGEPITTTLPLPCGAEAAGIARQYVRDHADHLPAELIEDAELLVSELVGNAVRHGRPAITLQVELQPPRIGVVVTDEGPDMPVLPTALPGPAGTGGRGLLIVDELAADWGVSIERDVGGKSVWFTLRASAER